MGRRRYSNDLRARVVMAVAEGCSRRAAGKRFAVSASSSIRWVELHEETGSVSPRPRSGRASPLEPHAAWLLELVDKEPDLTLAEIVERLLQDRGVRTSDSSVDRFFKRHGVSFKKTLHAAEQERSDVAAARQCWKAAQASLDANRLVFVDETGTSTKMVRTHGRCRRGQRLIGKAPAGHWKTTTFTAGLFCDGLVAPSSGRANERRSLPDLCRDDAGPEPVAGDIVVIDNLSARKSRRCLGRDRERGGHPSLPAALFADLNPIEMAFAKLKTLLRKAAARTRDLLWDAIADVLAAFTPHECANYLAHAGYASS